MSTHSQIVFKYEGLKTAMLEQGLKPANVSGSSLSFSNEGKLKLGSYSTHFTFVSFDTVEEGWAYLHGIEDGKKLSQPEKERK